VDILNNCFLSVAREFIEGCTMCSPVYFLDDLGCPSVFLNVVLVYVWSMKAFFEGKFVIASDPFTSLIYWC
jgi:hypothetical protein